MGDKIRKELTEEQKEKARERSKKWRIENKERKAENDKIYRKNNPGIRAEEARKYREKYPGRRQEICKRYLENNKEKERERKKIWRENNKGYHNEYSKKRKLEDPLYRFSLNIRNMIYQSITDYGFNKNLKTKEILGCEILEFKEYLESLFEEWMSWENKGLYNGELNYGWDIDHIIPLSKAKTEEDIISLNHYTNLQPLCSYTNRYIKRDN